MSGNAKCATPLCSSRPPGFPAIGSFLKVTLQSGHADVAGLAVGMKPAPLHPPFLLFSLPPTTHSSPLPHHHHLKDASSPPAGPGQRQDPVFLLLWELLSEKLLSTCLINNGPFLMQTLWMCSLLPFDAVGEFWGLDRRQIRRGGLAGDASKSFEFDDWNSHALFGSLYSLFSVLHSVSGFLFYFRIFHF